jgi:hypothetical protein
LVRSFSRPRRVGRGARRIVWCCRYKIIRFRLWKGGDWWPVLFGVRRPGGALLSEDLI